MSLIEQFVAGAGACCIASTFTNPIEVVKTRMQLQGELAAQHNTPRVYTGLLQAMKLIVKNEGFRGIQRGLVAAYWYQTALNGLRVGLFEPSRQMANKMFGLDPQQQVYSLSIATGMVTGAISSIPASPFYLIKVRMQSYSPVFQVGDQTHFTSIWGGLKSLYKQGAMFQGVGSAALKICVISSVQMPSYQWAKEALAPWVPSSSLYFLSSVVAGAIGATAVNPFDVIMTRMYNQKTRHYKSIPHCFAQTIKNEGWGALYKGFVAAGLRSSIQTVLSLTIMDHMFGWWNDSK